MTNQERVHWHCANRDCGWSVVTMNVESEAANPTCVCGAALQKSDMPPVFSYLDFLRGEEALWGNEDSGRER